MTRLTEMAAASAAPASASLAWVGREWGSRHGAWRKGRGGRRYPEEHADGKKVLERISKETGGRLFEVSRKEPVDKSIPRFRKNCGNQYNLGYTPDRAEAAEPGYHKIQVAAKKKDSSSRQETVITEADSDPTQGDHALQPSSVTRPSGA